MKSKISISDCRKAIAITRWNGSIAIGIPLTIRGEQVRAIIAEEARQRIERFPPAPPTISIRECQQAIEIAGGISITLRGEPMRITEISTRDLSKWVSGDIRFTSKEKELLTNQARAIIADQDTAPE